MENTKTTYAFKGYWILAYFGYNLGKVTKLHFLEIPQKSQNTRTFISIELPITK